METLVKDDNQVLYLLGFSPREASVGELATLAAEYSLEYLEEGKIRAWFRMLDASIFQGPEAESNLADINWLTPRVLMHESAVSAISEHTPLYPTRFGTLFSSQQALHASIAQWSDRLRGFFELVQDKREWGIKIWVDRKLLDNHLLEKISPVGKDSMTGSAYLRMRKAQQEITEKRTAFKEQISLTLEEIAAESQIPVLFRSATLHADEDKTKELINNVAILGSQGDLEILVSRLNQRFSKESTESMFEIVTTGPWAAYSFCPSLK